MLLYSNIHKLSYANQSVYMPVLGLVTFGADGSLNVPDEQVDEFILATKDTFDFSKKNEEGKAPREKSRVQELEDELKKLDFKELVQLAQNAEVKFSPNISDRKLRRLLAIEIEARENQEPEVDESE